MFWFGLYIVVGLLMSLAVLVVDMYEYPQTLSECLLVVLVTVVFWPMFLVKDISNKFGYWRD